jgi:VID27-like protein
MYSVRGLAASYLHSVSRSFVQDDDGIIPADTIVSTTKYADLTGEQTFIGMSSNQMFLMDPRLSVRCTCSCLCDLLPPPSPAPPALRPASVV